MFIRKEQKKATPKDEKEFGEMLQNEKVSFKDKLVMALTAMAVIVVPCLLILCAFGLLLLALFGALW